MSALIAANARSSIAGMTHNIGRIVSGVSDDNEESAAQFESAFSGLDFLEGIAAFSERRKPLFR